MGMIHKENNVFKILFKSLKVTFLPCSMFKGFLFQYATSLSPFHLTINGRSDPRG